MEIHRHAQSEVKRRDEAGEFAKAAFGCGSLEGGAIRDFFQSTKERFSRPRSGRAEGGGKDADEWSEASDAKERGGGCEPPARNPDRNRPPGERSPVGIRPATPEPANRTKGEKR